MWLLSVQFLKEQILREGFIYYPCTFGGIFQEQKKNPKKRLQNRERDVGKTGLMKEGGQDAAEEGEAAEVVPSAELEVKVKTGLVVHGQTVEFGVWTSIAYRSRSKV